MNVGKAAIRTSEMPLFAAFTFETFVISVARTCVDHDLGVAYGACTCTLAPKAGGDKMKVDAKFETLFKRQDRTGPGRSSRTPFIVKFHGFELRSPSGVATEDWSMLRLRPCSGPEQFKIRPNGRHERKRT